jgi:alkylation response protein AidB-like acyl-CoA dehydrogenase
MAFSCQEAGVDLEFDQEQAALRDSVRDVVDGISPPSVVRAIYEGRGDATDVWRQMVELDWPGLAIDPEHGGIGMGFLELAIVAEQLGRATVPGPFLSTATQFAPAISALADPSMQRRLLPDVAAGRRTGALAVAEGGSWRTRDLGRTLSVAADGDGWRLTGRKEAVLDGATADAVLVVARASDGVGAFLVTPEQVRIEPRAVIDPTMPLADLDFEDLLVSGDQVVATPGPDVAARADRAIEQATVALAVMTAAACRAIFERTVEYAKIRVQYDRQIGSFQALKHRMANMYLAVERAASVGWFAALTLSEDDPRRAEAVSVAKAAAGECQHLVVGDGLQLHGGIGFTWEHDLHFLLKRAKVGDSLFGNALRHRAILAERLGLTAPAGAARAAA